MESRVIANGGAVEAGKTAGGGNSSVFPHTKTGARPVLGAIYLLGREKSLLKKEQAKRVMRLHTSVHLPVHPPAQLLPQYALDVSS